MEDKAILLPSERQVEWADCEIGVIIHLDLQTFDPNYDAKPYDSSPVKLFDPDTLDTDQWIRIAAEGGAKYAVLTAKHGTGFTLFPSTANNFSISNAPYMNGKGDVVASFVASCKKYGVRPGIYYNTSVNNYYGIKRGVSKDGNEENTKAYGRAVLRQLEELYGNYGEFFEIWFDGGCLPPEQGGPDIVPLLKKYQPNAITFQSPPFVPNGIRWVGNERATAEFDCWSTVGYSRDSFDGITETVRSGDPYGEIWRAAEADTPGRDAKASYAGGWIWRAGEDHTVFSAEELFDKYLNSVGRNCNLLIGMVIDRHGLCPTADADALRGLGRLVSEHFGSPVATYEGDMTKTEYHLKVSDGRSARYLVVMEDIAKGERILDFSLDCGISGHCIGHKRIIRLPEGTSEVRFKINDAKDTPILRGIWLF
ncbi:MAG: hypothetical protein E7607_07745 [Ruminococcaceae bacterium]|nr:hypothetical protein [Oscillospiraceae bacterium]